MPELPEMRALAERMQNIFGSLQVSRVQLLGFSGLKTVAPQPSEFIGARLQQAESRGKYLLLDFGAPGKMMVHLGNSGRLDVEAPPKTTKPKGALARLEFGPRAALVREFGSERQAGLWALGPGDDGPLERLGPEPFEPAFADFVLTGDDRRHLHTLLRDQHTVAGIGRGYADDTLHRASLSPYATLTSLDAKSREVLLHSILDVLNEALASERQRDGGLSDASLGDRFAIHRRAGQACPRCGRKLERISYESNEVTYCPDCQTNGRVLADRRLSRLLR